MFEGDPITGQADKELGFREFCVGICIHRVSLLFQLPKKRYCQMIMQILPDLRKVEDERNIVLRKSGCRANSGEKK